MPEFSMLTLNAFGVPTGTSQRRLLALARELNASDYAVVALQEVQSHRYRRLLVDAANTYSSHAFEPFIHAPKGGLLTLARAPFLRREFSLYSSRMISHPPAVMDWMLHKGVLATELSCEGVPIVVLNTHLNANYSGDWQETNRYTLNERAQLKQLAELVGQQPADAIVIACGDFNIPRGSWLYDEFLARSGMADPLAGDARPTYRTPRGIPARYALPIDFALVRAPALPGWHMSADIAFVHRVPLARGGSAFVSDHMGIALRVGWANAQPVASSG